MLRITRSTAAAAAAAESSSTELTKQAPPKPAAGGGVTNPERYVYQPRMSLRARGVNPSEAMDAQEQASVLEAMRRSTKCLVRECRCGATCAGGWIKDYDGTCRGKVEAPATTCRGCAVCIAEDNATRGLAAAPLAVDQAAAAPAAGAQAAAAPAAPAQRRIMDRHGRRDYRKRVAAEGAAAAAQAAPAGPGTRQTAIRSVPPVPKMSKKDRCPTMGCMGACRSSRGKQCTNERAAGQDTCRICPACTPGPGQAAALAEGAKQVETRRRNKEQQEQEEIEAVAGPRMPMPRGRVPSGGMGMAGPIRNERTKPGRSLPFGRPAEGTQCPTRGCAGACPGGVFNRCVNERAFGKKTCNICPLCNRDEQLRAGNAANFRKNEAAAAANQQAAGAGGKV